MNPKIYTIVETSPLVDLDLKRKFSNLIATPVEIQGYLSQFCKRNGIDSTALAAIYGAIPSGGQPTNNNQGGFGNNNPGNQGGFGNNNPGNQGGFGNNNPGNNNNT